MRVFWPLKELDTRPVNVNLHAHQQRHVPASDSYASVCQRQMSHSATSCNSPFRDSRALCSHAGSARAGATTSSLLREQIGTYICSHKPAQGKARHGFSNTVPSRAQPPSTVACARTESCQRRVLTTTFLWTHWARRPNSACLLCGALTSGLFISAGCVPCRFSVHLASVPPIPNLSVLLSVWTWRVCGLGTLVASFPNLRICKSRGQLCCTRPITASHSLSRGSGLTASLLAGVGWLQCAMGSPLGAVESLAHVPARITTTGHSSSYTLLVNAHASNHKDPAVQIGFFATFLSTFAPPALIAVIREDLNMTGEDISTAGLSPRCFGA